ncbi:MAG: tyrosyl-tRNA synthetase [Candidatus Peregrinibacteria bacterium Greene0416_62]|nr:MAG: tyrosyl-tRNA synthetase [Candidatus Peregrinibacteria bacterium Greene0416_62]TSC98147.1 MAG: tyrosyl-tRNA synthetase [Candidatus Peregrinibacteria bacterium Greene1014_49]
MDHSSLLTRAVEEVVPKALAEEKLKSGKKLRLYLGIDPTGSKLHLGHSVPLRKLQAFADAGHEVIFLVGSFTAMIGDPSGRDALREPLTKEQVIKNFETYKEQASKVLDFSKVTIRYNHEWLEKLSFSDILKLGSHFTVQQMIKRDMFQKRIKDEADVAIAEFLYPIMVGYDSVILDVDCELGGSDQLFNMLAGRTLQQKLGKRDKFVLTTKLIEGTDGRKMSKTYDNCIWLEDSAKDMYGKTLRIEDRLITTYMECCTDIPMEEIITIEKAMNKEENPMTFKKELAHEIVRTYHGEEAAKIAAAEFTKVFTDKEMPSDIPEVKAKKGELLLDLLLREKLITSKSDGRRLLDQKGIHLNDKVVTDVNAEVVEGTYKIGKRKFVRFFL